MSVNEPSANAVRRLEGPRAAMYFYNAVHALRA